MVNCLVMKSLMKSNSTCTRSFMSGPVFIRIVFNVMLVISECMHIIMCVCVCVCVYVCVCVCVCVDVLACLYVLRIHSGMCS